MTKWIATITFEVEVEADTQENAEYQAEWYRCVNADDVAQMAKSESPLSVSAEQSVHPTVLCTCKLSGLDANNPAICPTCRKPHSG